MMAHNGLMRHQVMSHSLRSILYNVYGESKNNIGLEAMSMRYIIMGPTGRVQSG